MNRPIAHRPTCASDWISTAPRLLGVFAFAITAAFVCTTSARAEDLLVRSEGKASRVFQVTKATWSEVSYIPRKGIAEQSVDRAKIRRIRFGDTPAAYTTGRDAVAAGDYAKAIKLFKDAKADPKVRAWWATVWIQLDSAKAHVAWARQTGDKRKATEAVAIVDAVLREFPDNFFKPDYEITRIEARILAGDLAAAASEAEAFEREVSGWSEKEWYLRAKLLGAEALEGQGNYPAAISKLETLVSAADSAGRKDWSAEAMIRKGNAILAQGNKDAALREFRSLVSKIDPTSWTPRASASAHVGLGRVLLEHFDKPHEARDHLLTARVEFYSSERAAQEVMAAACYWLGMAAEKLAALGESGAKLEAGRYYQEVIDQFKSSAWVEKAKQGMNRVR